jgi:hypothetical protein
MQMVSPVISRCRNTAICVALFAHLVEIAVWAVLFLVPHRHPAAHSANVALAQARATLPENF